ncbi:MAG: NrsF family protein [Rhodospirillales bacterium]
MLAAAAAFITSVPGRSPAWALLPLPPFALWLSAGTAGCLRMQPAPGTLPEPPMHAMACIYFIILVSVPLSILLMWQITRACPLRPALTASLAGLASAGAAAVILALVHPFDATYTDLLAHLAAVVLVVAAVRIAGERALR